MLEMKFQRRLNILGIIFNYNNKFTKAEKKLSEQARKALFALKKNISDMSFNNETLLSLFDCYIGGTCIVKYVSEIWGIHKGNNVKKTSSRILQTHAWCTSNMAVYAELGRVQLT